MINTPPSGKCPDTIIDKSPAEPFAQIIRLCNFAVGKAELLSAHRLELIHQLTSHSFEGSGGEIAVVGYASKLGFADSSKSNQKLSEDRAWAVKLLIEEHGQKVLHGFKVTVSLGLGDTGLAQKDSTGNDGFFRAVEVKFVIHKNKFNPFPKPNSVPQPPAQPHQKPSKSFMFQAIQVTSGTVSSKICGVQGDVMEFAIRDMVNGRTRYYRYFGSSAGAQTPDLLKALKIFNAPFSFAVGRASEKVPFFSRLPIVDLSEWELGDLPSLSQTPGVSADKLGFGYFLFRLRPKSAPLLNPRYTVNLVFTTSRGIAMPSLGSHGNGVVVMMDPYYHPRRFPGEDLL